jgi:hypothetical protein
MLFSEARSKGNPVTCFEGTMEQEARWLGAPPAPRVRTVKRCSFDTRSGGATWPSSWGDAFRLGWRRKWKVREAVVTRCMKRMEGRRDCHVGRSGD